MIKKIDFNCLTTMIGSMPQVNPDEACSIVAKFLPDVPAWPQLPGRSRLENMYIQYSEGFPGIIVDGTKIQVDRSDEFDQKLEQLYTAYAENKMVDYAISKDYAAGLYAFQTLKQKSPIMVKGQITGPISWGLCVTDHEQRGILYDELLAETIAKFLRLKAMWQESFLRRIAKDTIIFVDEPYLASLGSAFVAISSEQVATLLEEVLGGISGINGIHCCGSTDWSILLKSSTDILSFDAYNYADSLTTYLKEANAFLNRGSTIAWGIVPNDEDHLAKESLATLYDRLCEAIAPFTRDGIPFKQVFGEMPVNP